MSLVTTTQAVEQIHVDCFEIEIADIKGEVFIFFRMRLDASAGVVPCVPLCIPNIDCPAIASIFSQSL